MSESTDTDNNTVIAHDNSGWEQPLISVDVVPVRLNKQTGETTVILAERMFEPFLAEEALPGVLLTPNERVTEAAYRALVDKAGISKDNIKHLIDVGVSDNPNRDPRGATLSIVMLAIVDSDTDLGVKAVEKDLDKVNSIELPFDHNNLILKAVGHLASSLFEEKEVTRSFLGEQFRSNEAQKAQSIVSSLSGHVETDNPSNFSRKLRHTGWLEQSEVPNTADDKRPRGRPSASWTWK